MKKVLFILIIFLAFISNTKALGLSSIYIDGKSCTNNSSIETCLSGETYSYDSENKTLTLNNYNGGRVTVYSKNTTAEDEITIHLKGENTVTYTGSDIYAFGSGIPLTITADENASLTINGNYQNDQYISIGLSSDKSLTIEGGTINVNLRTDFDSDTNLTSVGISAIEGLIIRGNAKVSVNIDTDYNIISAVRVGKSSSEEYTPLHLGPNASLKINMNARNKLNAENVYISSYTTYGTNTDFKIEGTVEEPSPIHKIIIDDKVCLNDSNIEECVNAKEYSWDSENNILTLNNYNSGRIYITTSGTSFNESKPVKIHLKGNNIITEKSEYSAIHSDFDTEISADNNATLTVHHSNQTTKQNQAVSIKKLLTISGGNITINNNYNYENDKQISTFNISAYHGVIIKNDATVNLNALNDYSHAVGIIVGGTNIENPPIHVEKNAKLNIDLKVKNKLKASSITRFSYTYYGGTIGKPDIKIEGNVKEYNTIKTITIDGKTCWNDTTIEECASGSTYSWDLENNTLTLNNYNSERIYFNAIGNRLGEDEPVKIVLKGNNTITEKSTYSALFSDFNTEITSNENANLIVNYSNQSTSQHQAIYINKLLTISGGNIEFNNDYNFESTKSVNSFVVYSKYGIIIKGNSNVKIKSHTDYSYTRALVFGGTNVESPKLYVEDPATLKIDFKAKNKLDASTISTNVYSVYSGTIGSVDKKITGKVEENPIIDYIHIDNKKCLNNGKINECFNNEKYIWDEETNTITLNNYNSGRIYVVLATSSMLTTPSKSINIYLKGKNNIKEKSEYIGLYSNGNILIDGDKDSSLDIEFSKQNTYSNSAVDTNGMLTIQGGNININNTYEYDAGKDVAIYAIEANGGLIIKDDSNVKLNVINNYSSVRGIVVGGENIENPKIYLENPASLEVNLVSKNILKAENISLKTYTYFTGTIGAPDIKISGSLLEKPSFREMIIDGKKCVNDSNVESCLKGETYSYSRETNTLTLNNYRGNQISIVAVDPNLGYLEPIKVHLIGKNEIISESDYNTPFEVQDKLGLVISAEENASLSLTRKCTIEGANVGLYVKNADITITGGNILINNIYEKESSPTIIAAGIYLNNLNLKGNTNLQINVETNYAKAYGIYFMNENPTITIEKPAELTINTFSKNLKNSNEKMILPFFLSKNPDKDVELVYKANDNTNAKIIAGTNEENTKLLTDISGDLSKYRYFKIEPSDEISNPKTGENGLIYLLFVMIITFALGSIMFINKKQII